MAKLVVLCSAIYFGAILLELFFRRRIFRFLLEAAVYLAVLALAALFNGSRTGMVSFGTPGASPIATIGTMFVAIILGIAARFVFYLEKKQFSWLDLLKPIAISPMVLLPLIGSVQATENLSSMQVISFAVLAFQNGFFWQAVLSTAKPSTSRARG